MDSNSKPLGHSDDSAFSFVREMLKGQNNYGINLDRLMYLKSENKFIIFEFQKCEERQSERGITPHTSHPINYWNRCWRKYESIWRVIQKLEAKFYVINYAETGTKHEKEIRVILVEGVSEAGMIFKTREWTRCEFSVWFQTLNDRCGKEGERDASKI